jgi:hypothetical protein
LKHSQPFLDYIVEEAIGSNDQKKPSGKVETINAILPYLKLVKDRIERAEHFERIADRLKIDSRLIREEFKKAVDKRVEKVSDRVITASIAVKPAERKLLEVLLNCATIRRKMLLQITEDDYLGLRTANLFRLVFEFERQGKEATYPALSQDLDDEDLAYELLPQLMTGERQTQAEEASADQIPLERAEREAAESLHSLRCAKLAEKQAALQIEINQAQRSNNSARLSELLMLKFELAKQERALVQWDGQENNNKP